MNGSEENKAGFTVEQLTGALGNPTFDNMDARELSKIIIALGVLDNFILLDVVPERCTGEVVEEYKASLLPITLLTTKDGSNFVALGDDPALNPAAAQFDVDRYKAEINNLLGIGALDAEISQFIIKYAKKIIEIAPSEKPEKYELENNYGKLLYDPEQWTKNRLGEYWDLLPYISTELAKPNNAEIRERAKRENWNLQDFQNTEAGQQIIDAARFEKARTEQSNFLTARKINRHPVLTDKEMKLPFNIFNEFINSQRGIDGQISMLPVKADHRYTTTDKQTGKKRTITKELTAFFSVNFSDALPPHIARVLTPTDRLVYGAVYALSEQSPLMSISQIGHAMGYRGDIGESKRAEIWKSLQKMGGAFVWYDFHEERTYYKGSAGYENIGVDGKAGENLLSFKARANVTINGAKTDDAILLLAPPVLYTVAMQRNYRVSKVPIECLQLPGKMNRDDRTIAMMFYILERIDEIKNPKETTKNKILYKSIYEACGLDAKATRKTRYNFNNKLFAYLDHLKAIKYITGYQEETTESTGEIGIKIFF